MIAIALILTHLIFALFGYAFGTQADKAQKAKRRRFYNGFRLAHRLCHNTQCSPASCACANVEHYNDPEGES